MPELTVQKNSTKKLLRFDGSPKASKKRAPETNAASPQTPENRSRKRRRSRAIHVDDSDDGKTSETSNEILNEISPAAAAVHAVDAADVPAATSEHATPLVAASPIQGDAVKANAPKTIAAVARDSQRDDVDNNVAPRRGIFAIAKPANPADQKLATVKAAIALLQSAFDVPNVNELDENDKIRLRETFIEATQVYAHDTLVLRSYDRANDENDWTQLIKHVTAVKGMLKTTQASLERQAQEGPPKASLPQKKYLQTLGYDENAPGNTKFSELTMDEARMLITSLKAAKLFSEK